MDALCVQLTQIESVFRSLKSELGIRPTYHQLEHRADAHVRIAFLAYCLQVTLKNRGPAKCESRVSSAAALKSAGRPHPVAGFTHGCGRALSITVRRMRLIRVSTPHHTAGASRIRPGRCEPPRAPWAPGGIAPVVRRSGQGCPSNQCRNRRCLPLRDPGQCSLVLFTQRFAEHRFGAHGDSLPGPG